MLPLIQGIFDMGGGTEPPDMPTADGLKSYALSGARLAAGADVSVMQEPGLICAAVGSPRFADRLFAATSREAGPAAAWLRAWHTSGPAAATGVAGRFSVVVIDTRKRECWMAVDRFGSFPLCHAMTDGVLAFSDRADCVPMQAREVDRQAIFDYLFFHHIPAPETIFRGVHRLPAAHSLSATASGAKVQAHWAPLFTEPRSGDFRALQSEFLDIVQRAVTDEADGSNVGAFLSGGTDSSTVSGMLCRVLGAPARTYSMGFDANGYDEMEYARIAARHFKTDHHEYYVRPEDILEGIPSVAAHFDQPFGNSSAVPAWICARRARTDGVDKMLAGDGGDELFGGNSRYAKQRVFDWYELIPGAVSRGLIEPALALPGMAKLPIISKGVSYVEQARVPLPDRTEMYNLLHRLGMETVFTPSFLSGIDPEHPARMQRETWQGIRADKLINRMLAFDWKYTLADNDLPKVVGATSLAGLDVGFPLLSDELVDFSLRLPPEWKLKGLTLRWFFKEALRGFLPDEIIAKKKHGFGLPFGVWAVKHPGLRAHAVRALQSFASRDIIRGDFIHRLVTDLLPTHPGYYGEMVWIIMMLEEWLTTHPVSSYPSRRVRADTSEVY